MCVCISIEIVFVMWPWPQTASDKYISWMTQSSEGTWNFVWKTLTQDKIIRSNDLGFLDLIQKWTDWIGYNNEQQ